MEVKVGLSDKMQSKHTRMDNTIKQHLKVNLCPLTPKDLTKYSHPKNSIKQENRVSFEPHTPRASIELSLELKKVLHERNILTSKTRKRVFQALDEIKSNTEEERRSFKREKALLEIVNSELKYVKHLETIITYFIKPVHEKKLLKPDDYEILFGNVITIYNINTELLEELDKGFDNVTNAFSKIAPFLKLYSGYAYDFKKTLKILQNARCVNPVFAKFVESQETRPEVQNKLSALLITPIQRVPRYKLLLNQLFELTTSKDKDFLLLKECLVKIEEAASHINKVIEEQENAQRLLELQRYLRAGEPNIISPGRKLKMEGILHKMSTKNGYSEKFYVVLMNDIIMFSKMKKEEVASNSLKIAYIFPLNKCRVIEILDKGCLKIECQDEGLILYHDELSVMISWVKTIQHAIDSYLEDRKTLRKDSSNRRAVKRKDVNEYNEIGLSPGQPLKKRKCGKPETCSAVSPRFRVRIAARRSIHAACNSTPIKLESHPETRHLNAAGFPMVDGFPNGRDLNVDKIYTVRKDLIRNEIKDEKDFAEVAKQKGIFLFGRKHNQNASKIGTMFKGFGTTLKGILGMSSTNKS